QRLSDAAPVIHIVSLRSLTSSQHRYSNTCITQLYSQQLGVERVLVAILVFQNYAALPFISSGPWRLRRFKGAVAGKMKHMSRFGLVGKCSSLCVLLTLYADVGTTF